MIKETIIWFYHVPLTLGCSCETRCLCLGVDACYDLHSTVQNDHLVYFALTLKSCLTTESELVYHQSWK